MQRKTWNRIIPAIAGLTATAVGVLPADAHEGHHEQMALPEAVRHLVSQPDHQMMFAALVVLAVAGGWAWRRRAAK